MQKRISKVAIRQRHNSSTSSITHQNGFSLIEFALTLVLLVVGATLSLPTYREMVEKQDLTEGAEQIVAFINMARAESVERQQPFTLVYSRSSEGEWCFGASPGDTTCDCTEENSAAENYCAIDSAPRLINSTNTDNTRLTRMGNDTGSFTFDPVQAADTSANSPLIVEIGSETENILLAMVVNNSDRVILCLKDSSESLSGYEVCPADLAGQGVTESIL